MDDPDLMNIERPLSVFKMIFNPGRNIEDCHCKYLFTEMLISKHYPHEMWALIKESLPEIM